MFTAGAGGIAASNISFVTTGGLELRSGGDIDIHGAEGGISGVINAAGNFHAVANVTTGDLTAGGSIAIDDGNLSVVNVTGGTTFMDTIEVAGDISASGSIIASGDVTATNITAGTTISVGGGITAEDVTAGGAIVVGSDADAPNRDLFANSVTAGGDITAFGTLVATISSPHGVLRVGDDGILPFLGSAQGADLQHTITVDSIVSSGGIFFSGNLFGGTNGLSNGGLLTINARTILFDDGTNGIGFTTLDGANFGAFNGADPAMAGDGGTLIVHTTGNITATSGLGNSCEDRVDPSK